MNPTERRVPFIWEGSDCSTLGTLLDAVRALPDPEKGAKFMAAYVENLRANQVDDPETIARANVGYIIGYVGGMDDESVAERTRLYELVGARHPIFGIV